MPSVLVTCRLQWVDKMPCREKNNNPGPAPSQGKISLEKMTYLNTILFQKKPTNWVKIAAISAGIGGVTVLTGGAAVVAAPLVVAGLGFGAGGIAAGSTAAAMMSAWAPTAAGGIVATLQSVGAAGLGAAGTAAVATAGGVAGAAASGATTVVAISDEQKRVTMLHVSDFIFISLSQSPPHYLLPI